MQQFTIAVETIFSGGSVSIFSEGSGEICFWCGLNDKTRSEDLLSIIDGLIKSANCEFLGQYQINEIIFSSGESSKTAGRIEQAVSLGISRALNCLQTIVSKDRLLDCISERKRDSFFIINLDKDIVSWLEYEKNGMICLKKDSLPNFVELLSRQKVKTDYRIFLYRRYLNDFLFLKNFSDFNLKVLDRTVSYYLYQCCKSNASDNEF